MGLVNGSREFYDLSEHAERLYRAASEARRTEERREIAKRANKFADRMEEDYGIKDPQVERIIESYYLRRLD